LIHRIRLFLWASALCVAGSAFPAPLRSLHVTAKVTHAGKGEASKVDKTEFWVKNGKSRMQTGPFVVITDGKNRYAFRVSDPHKVLMVMPLPETMAGNATLGLIRQWVPPNAKRKKIGTAKMLGHSTAIYELTRPGKTGAAKLWEATDLGVPLPLRLEMKSPEGTETVAMNKVEVNPSLPDTLFVAPAGYKPMKVPPMPSFTGGKGR
jgi:hypothetical protein